MSLKKKAGNALRYLEDRSIKYHPTRHLTRGANFLLSTDKLINKASIMKAREARFRKQNPNGTTSAATKYFTKDVDSELDRRVRSAERSKARRKLINDEHNHRYELAKEYEKKMKR